MNKPEILAPAGSMETLESALRTGANAVYAGGKNFSARSSAVNFTEQELYEAVRLCHIYGAKFYLAVNTVISDNETEEFCRYIKNTALIGVDGYIVQDWGATYIIKKAVPNAVLHASTQMSVHTVSGAGLLKELGYKRVVPARELDKNVLEKISSLGIETEVFVHGALCMSVSGQCYMSAIMGSRSANRGRCGQACRLPFSCSGNKSYSALSLKDLSLIPKANELCEIGIDSLKIEGRMKRPEYVASAVNELKKALDGEIPDMNLLRGIFSRSGFTDGYFTGNTENMFGIREKEDVIASHELIPKIHELYRNERQVHALDFEVNIKSGVHLKITAICGNLTVTETGGTLSKAEKRSVDEEYVKKQLSKLGDTVFYLNSIKSDIDGGLFVPISELNRIRRSIAEKMSELIINKNTPVYTVTGYTPKLSETVKSIDKKITYRTFCRNVEQVKVAVEFSEYVILDDFLSMSELWIAEILQYVDSERVILSPPRFIYNEERVIKSLEYIKSKFGFEHLFCHTLDGIAVGKKLGFKLHGNFTLNAFNSYSLEYLENIGLDDCIFSFEAKVNQFDGIRTSLDVGALVYGNIPLMLTRNCPIKNEIGCKRCNRYITDRTGRGFNVICHAYYVEILNTDTLYMLDRLDDLKNVSFGLVMLNNETPEQVRGIFSGEKPKSITRGLYYRGLESLK